jgi:sugar lactone lactonase YvrE
MFANGVALGPDENFVLVNETIAGKITRLWLRGPRAGERDTFIELPAYPDNLSYNGKGIFWVAMASPRSRALEKTWGTRMLRKVVARLPQRWIRAGAGKPLSWVIGIDPNGKVVRNLQDPDGWGSVTSVNEFDGKLYFGSIATTFVGRYRLH